MRDQIVMRAGTRNKEFVLCGDGSVIQLYGIDFGNNPCLFVIL